MSKIIRTTLATGIAAAFLAVPTTAFADPPGDGPSYGNQVKECVKNSACYGGKNRGSYVREEAKDGTGFHDELETFADPGRND
jgi:hypothetical protein